MIDCGSNILLPVFFLHVLQTWKSLPDANEITKDLPGVVVRNLDATIDHLASSNMFFIAKRKNVNKDLLYLSAKTPRNILFLVELTVLVGTPGIRCAIKTPSPEMAVMFFETMETLLN